MANNKTLYFEGAGCVPRGDVSNCRIRTAFHLDNGNSVYLEISGMETTRSTAPCYQNFTNYGVIDHCFCISGTWDDGTSHHKAVRSGFAFEYSQAGILEFVNSLGASFDSFMVLPDLAGYRVHGDGRNAYNFADEFIFDPDLLEKRQRVYDEIREREFARGEKSPCFSLWVDHKDPAILHYHNCRNGEKFDICVDMPNDSEALPVLNKSNAIVGGYYAGCGYLLKVYRISEEYAERYDLMYLDRCEVSSYGDMALPGSDVYRRKAPRN
jgi:hypothetical protein